MGCLPTVTNKSENLCIYSNLPFITCLVEKHSPLYRQFLDLCRPSFEAKIFRRNSVEETQANPARWTLPLFASVFLPKCTPFLLFAFSIQPTVRILPPNSMDSVAELWPRELKVCGVDWEVCLYACVSIRLCASLVRIVLMDASIRVISRRTCLHTEIGVLQSACYQASICMFDNEGRSLFTEWRRIRKRKGGGQLSQLLCRLLLPLSLLLSRICSPKYNLHCADNSSSPGTQRVWRTCKPVFHAKTMQASIASFATYPNRITASSAEFIWPYCLYLAAEAATADCYNRTALIMHCSRSKNGWRR